MPLYVLRKFAFRGFLDDVIYAKGRQENLAADEIKKLRRKVIV